MRHLFEQISQPRSIYLILILLLGWLAYAPGLHGSFLFDDFANLPALGSSGPINNWPSFWRYITSGTADPTGRPLTLLSFLIDANNWPAAPYRFKQTNLVLHLLNGVLLYFLLVQLSQILVHDKARCHMAALIGMALWLLHPLLVSTTLYIVQREAMLPASCILSGLLIWLYGRSQLAAGKKASGLLYCLLGVGGFTLLAVLAKANGVLLPLYVLLIETILLAPRQALLEPKVRRAYRIFLTLFTTLPTIGVVTYIAWIGVHGIVGGGPALRPWTYAQRLLTEPRILLDYLSHWWSPRPFSSGLFNDQYAVSTSLWHPITTLPSIICVLLLIIIAWWLRRRNPAIALATLFYFGGQLIESTSIPLELYFEHRNYVPALLMCWPLGLWLSDTTQLSAVKRGLSLMLLICLAAMTHVRAEVWGNVETQAEIWAHINPSSPRAQTNAAQIELKNGHTLEAAVRLEVLLRKRPDEAQLALNLVGARCTTGGLSAGDMEDARSALRTSANVSPLFVHWFQYALPIAMSGSCPGFSIAELQSLIDAGLSNPKLQESGPQQDFIYLRGAVALAQHRPRLALRNFIQALNIQVRPDIALQTAAALGAGGYPAEGVKLLDHYQKISGQTAAPSQGMPILHEWVLTRENYWPNEIAHLRQQLILDAKAHSINTLPETVNLDLRR